MYETFLGPERLNIVSGSGAVVLVSMLLELQSTGKTISRLWRSSSSNCEPECISEHNTRSMKHLEIVKGS